MEYFDAHCHVQLSEYDADREEVLTRMQESGVGGLVVGVDLTSSQAAVELARERSALYASVGLHPNDVLREEFNEIKFETLLADPMVRAIGECGLDYYRPDEPAAIEKKQKEVFEKQIELAVKYNKPLMIHSRPRKGSQDAYQDTIDILQSKKREYGEKLRGDMHFFVGGIEEARVFIDLGFTLSYTAVITFTHDYDEVIRFAPLQSLLSETDSPFVAPAPNRGKRNEPIAVREVVRTIAGIREETEELVQNTILQTAARLFSFSL